MSAKKRAHAGKKQVRGGGEMPAIAEEQPTVGGGLDVLPGSPDTVEVKTNHPPENRPEGVAPEPDTILVACYDRHGNHLGNLQLPRHRAWPGQAQPEGGK
ncbi:MAG: hypothetical protein AAGK14_15540 [Verrucomicrobiota bacterium]